MSNYVKSTSFTSKDTLPSGDPLKIVKGAEFDTEFNNIATASSSKADTNSPVFTGVPITTTAAFGNATNQIASNAFVQTALAAIYPVGSMYTNTSVATNPATLLGFGTWVAFGSGRVPVGVGGIFTAGATGGSADSTLPSHTHGVNDPGHTHTSNAQKLQQEVLAGGPSNTVSPAAATINAAFTGISINAAGVSPTNTNYQPYIVVYMWTRTA